MRLIVPLSANLLVASACGGATVAAGPTVPTLVSFGASQRTMVALTDLDTVFDVAGRAGETLVGTDRGVLVYAAGREGTPTRVTKVEGLPADDVRAIAVAPSGVATVTTGAGLADLSGTTPTAHPAPPPVGRVADIAYGGETLFACGELGLAERTADGWVKVGEPFVCTTIHAVSATRLWIGTTDGVLEVDGEVAREHTFGQGVPAEYVRAVVPVGERGVLALLQSSVDSRLGYWDGLRWFGYTADGVDGALRALVEHGGKPVLITQRRAFGLALGSSESGAPMTPLMRSERFGPRSYRLRRRGAADVPAGTGQAAAPDRDPTPFASIDPNRPRVDAPSWFLEPLSISFPEDVYLARTGEGHLYLADRNRGVVAIGPSGSSFLLRSGDLVHERDLQIAADADGQTWVLGRSGDVGRLTSSGLVRVTAPEGVSVQAIASAPGSTAFAAALVPATPGLVRIYRLMSTGFEQVVERALVLPTALVRIPFMGIAPSDVFWLAIDVQREEGTGTGARTRGAVVMSAATEVVTYHHRGAQREGPDGPEALALQDEIATVDLTDEGMAWFASLSGAVRLGNSQAVVFGEARGVPGEVVTDVAVAPNSRIWIAAAEGLGYYEHQTMEFGLPPPARQARPLALAVDTDGHLWAAGPRGALHFDGTRWTAMTTAEGLPTNDLRDVEVDARGRVWLLLADRVLVLARP